MAKTGRLTLFCKLRGYDSHGKKLSAVHEMSHASASYSLHIASVRAGGHVNDTPKFHPHDAHS
jgi:hypothetical protein